MPPTAGSRRDELRARLKQLSHDMFASKNYAGFSRGDQLRFEHQAVLSELLERALDDHAEALSAAAASSDKYASRLVWATWALVLATLGLIFTALFGK